MRSSFRRAFAPAALVLLGTEKSAAATTCRARPHNPTQNRLEVARGPGHFVEDGDRMAGRLRYDRAQLMPPDVHERLSGWALSTAEAQLTSAGSYGSTSGDANVRVPWRRTERPSPRRGRAHDLRARARPYRCPRTLSGRRRSEHDRSNFVPPVANERVAGSGGAQRRATRSRACLDCEALRHRGAVFTGARHRCTFTVESGCPTGSSTFGAVPASRSETLEFDVSLVTSSPQWSFPTRWADGRPISEGCCFVTVFARRVRGVSRSEKASRVRHRNLCLLIELFASRDP